MNNKKGKIAIKKLKAIALALVVKAPSTIPRIYWSYVAVHFQVWKRLFKNVQSKLALGFLQQWLHKKNMKKNWPYSKDWKLMIW